MTIHRQEVFWTHEIAGPDRVTFAYQPARDEWSIWFDAAAPYTHRYIVVPTCVETNEPHELVASAVMPDGHTIFHLVRRPMT